jgi:hypothetical protein
MFPFYLVYDVMVCHCLVKNIVLFRREVVISWSCGKEWQARGSFITKSGRSV